MPRDAEVRININDICDTSSWQWKPMDFNIALM